MTSDRDYYRARCAQETVLAERADLAEVTRVHQELADRYRLHAEDGQPRLKIVR